MTQPHRVARGQTLVSIAANHGITWQELARLNWGTDVPRQINWHLYHDVGCREPNGPSDPFDAFANYRFSDDDINYGSGTIQVPDPPAPPSAPPSGTSASSGAVAGATSAAGTSTVTTIGTTYAPGDVLLRAGTEAWIMKLTGGPYSHAGICIDSVAKTAADAHPIDAHRSAGFEVASLPISDFFSTTHAPGGGDVFRYTGSSADATKAATWAKGECGKPYVFDIMDPILGATGTVNFNNKLYCSEFVWHCYKEGAGIELVKPADFINLLSEANIDRTLEALLPQIREQMDIPWYVPDFYVKWEAEKKLKSMHNGFFVAPVQLADSALTKKVHSIRGGASMPSSDKK